MSGKRFLIGLVLLCSALRAPSLHGQEVQWRYDYTKARDEANAVSLPLLIDFGTENCFWCKQLDVRTFRDPAVVKLLNERFVPLKIDANKDASLAQELRVQTYPTLILA